MTTETLHPLAADYLQQLRRAARTLPPGRRRDLLAEIEGHLSEGIDPSAPDAQAQVVLDKLGSPETIIAAENPGPDGLAPRRGAKEWVAIALLLVGGVMLGVGWLAGLVLLWTSRAWTTADKWIGTLILPGGLATSVILGLLAIGEPTKRRCMTFGATQQCTNVTGHNIPSSTGGVVIFVLLVLAPIATALHLARRAS